MKQISYQEAIELMAFAGRKDIYMGKLEPAFDIKIGALSVEANDGALFFVGEAEPPKMVHDPEPAKKPCVTVPVPGTPGETVKLAIGAEPESKSGKHGKRPNLDMGKIMALKHAGWSVPKIADELGVSNQTIYNRLSKMEEKKDVNEDK